MITAPPSIASELEHATADLLALLGTLSPQDHEDGVSEGTANAISRAWHTIMREMGKTDPAAVAYIQHRSSRLTAARIHAMQREHRRGT